MPAVDMPIEELKKYMGRNPKPADFDAYWERALQEMRDTEANPEFIPAEFQVPGYECFDLYFTGVKNARIHCKFIKPQNIAGKAPVVFWFHGYSADSGDWADKLRYAALGFVVCAIDCRGQGGLSEDSNPVKGNTLTGHIIRGASLNDNPDNLYFRQVYLDIAQMVSIVKSLDFVDENRMGAYGGSMGGGLTLACAALVPEIKKAYAIYPFLCDFKRAWEIDLAYRAYNDIRDYFRYYDPRHQHEQEFFERLGYIDVANLASRIQAEVVMATALLDQTCPPSTQFAAYNRIQSKKHLEVFPDYAHENLKGIEDLNMQFLISLLED